MQSNVLHIAHPLCFNDWQSNLLWNSKCDKFNSKTDGSPATRMNWVVLINHWLVGKQLYPYYYYYQFHFIFKRWNQIAWINWSIWFFHELATLCTVQLLKIKKLLALWGTVKPSNTEFILYSPKKITIYRPVFLI